MYDLLIIGNGPAGLAAGIYGKRAGLNCAILAKAPLGGGQILSTYEVDNYPGLPGVSGITLGQELEKHAKGLGVETILAEVTGISVKEPSRQPGESDSRQEASCSFRGEPDSLQGESDDSREKRHFLVSAKIGFVEEKTLAAKTLLLATGADHQKLGIPGEEELLGMGVSYCATCDGAFFKGATVAVVGGGDVALEDAIFLSRICKQVYLIHRRDAFRGAFVLQEKVKETENITILWDTVVEGIEGEDQVETLRLYRKKQDVRESLSVNGVFIAVGTVPNSDLANGLARVDEGGYVVAGEDGVTTCPGFFVAGDVRTKVLRQVVTAVADGANAVTGVERYLMEL